ncbi:hypothetical protein LDO31_02915 [Luteimonas sp. XNQY3]|nr:hypothetical protein [Luteimonas sp. XNQY3]MCD9005198.1 hypothetical protein [Luteimonas sp. XNQY3]
MKTDAAKKIARKRATRPIYLRPMRLADPTDGVEYAAFVPANAIDQRLCRERKYSVNQEYRAEIKASRNVAFHRLAHALGHLLVDSVDDFAGLDAHAALKRVQLESGIACTVEERDARPVIDAVLAAAEATLGQGAAKVLAGVLPVIETIPIKTAQSLAFDAMDEDEFAGFFTGICDHIDANYSSVMTDSVRAEYLLMTGGQRRAA